MLGAFALALGEDFYPWVAQAASILVPLLKYYIHDGVRKIACDEICYLLHSAKLAVDEGTAQAKNRLYFKQLSGDIILALGNALYSEPETKICAIILGNLNKCLELCGTQNDEDQVCSIIDEIKHVIIESSRRKGELARRAKSEDFDAEEAELMRDEREQEAEIFRNVGNILSTLIKASKAAFLPFLDELSSYLFPYLTANDETAAERRTCFFIFTRILEHCGEAAPKYYNICLPYFLESSNDESPYVRQNALYGLVICAEYGGSAFRPFLGDALSRINVVITHFNALEPGNVNAYCNAIYALDKICLFHRESTDSVQIFPTWLNCLPIKGDLIEAKVVHDKLCSMVERSDTELLGTNYEHLPKIMSIFAEVLCAGKDLATKKTRIHMKKLLWKLKKRLPPTIWTSAWSLLLPQQEMELDSILQIETHRMKKGTTRR